MKQFVKPILKRIISEKIISNLYLLKPEILYVNIYLLKKNKPILNLAPISKKYSIRQLNISDSEKLKKFYINYKHIVPRLESSAWVGMAVIDITNDAIAYVSWIIVENIDFIKELNIEMKKNQFMVRHGYCDPKYRHQGLHTRMEQERINYCIRNGADEIFVHIARKNKIGIATIVNSGYEFYQKNLIVRIPRWGIYREFFSALKNPFKKVL